MAKPHPIAWLFAGAALVLAACSGLQTPSDTPTALSPSPTALPPTATSPPAAAVVNGSPIWLSDYEAEVKRLRMAQEDGGTKLATSSSIEETALEALIDLELLAQEAEKQGVSITEETLSQQIDQLSETAGDSANAGAWMAAYGYDLASLRRALLRQELAQATVENLADQVPAELEQVQARHILVADQALADQLRQELLDGADFGELALEHSLDLSTRVDGGNLGWFPRGVLTQPEVEQAAFELPVGEVSAVIQTELGYHLVEVLDKGVRPLTPNNRRSLRISAVESWLQATRQSAAIEILVDY